MKKVWVYTINFLLIGATATGAGIAIYNVINNDDFSKNIYVSEEGEKYDSWNINITGIFPGQKLNYEVNFLAKNSFPYDVTLSFTKGEKIELAKYVNLDIKIGDKDISNGLLDTYFTSEKLKLSNNKDDMKLKLIYEMPVNVGNEAQKLVADFSMDFLINNKGAN